MQGEYVIPSSATIPRSAADVALGGQGTPRKALSPFETDTGRWRVQVQPPLPSPHNCRLCEPEPCCNPHPVLVACQMEYCGNSHFPHLAVGLGVNPCH